MKRNTKVIVFVVCIVAVITFIIARIVYVNSILYNIPKRISYNINESFEYDGMNISVSDYKIYSEEELNSKYNNELDGMTDEFDILFNLKITNNSNESKNYNATASGIMYGYESGGNVNPYLYQYFNLTISGTIELKPNESITVWNCQEKCSQEIPKI